MELCEVPGCNDKAGLSCSCNEKIKMCAVHYSDVHKSVRGSHSPIFIHEILNKVKDKVFNEYRRNLDMISEIVSRGNDMINSVQLIIDDLVGKIYNRNEEIQNRIMSPFVEVVKTLGEYDLNEFIDLSKKYLKILVIEEKPIIEETKAAEEAKIQIDKSEAINAENTKFEATKIILEKTNAIEEVKVSLEVKIPVEKIEVINAKNNKITAPNIIIEKGKVVEEVKASLDKNEDIKSKNRKINAAKAKAIFTNPAKALNPYCTLPMTVTYNSWINEKKCNRCKYEKQLYKKNCLHTFCENCIVEKCCICSIKYLELKCESCGNVSTDNKILICDHIQCMRCVMRDILCRKCNIRTCQKCLHSFPKLIEKQCKHKVCEACFDEEIESDECGLCRFKDCTICKENGYEHARFICGHTGCGFCFVPDLPCWKCTFTGKKVAVATNEVMKCFRCKNDEICTLLICRDYVCERCIKEIDIVKFNYLCSDCCISREKKCIDCKKICIWEVTGKYLHKICCNDYFCKFCLKKKSFFLKDCKCS